MRRSTLAAVALAALLVVAGCTGLPGAGDDQPSPDDFPEASAIDQSVFDTHASALENTSFTLTIERSEAESDPLAEQNVTYRNETSRILVEPTASQYLAHYTYSGESSLLRNGSIYSNGSEAYWLSYVDGGTDVSTVPTPSVFDESRDQYLWQYWFDSDVARLQHAAIDADFERRGIETFRGDPVMRYEATGVDALSETVLWDENASEQFEAFSATLLLDDDGVVRHFEYELVFSATDSAPRRERAVSYTLTDVGSTDVEKPEWVANATTAS